VQQVKKEIQQRRNLSLRKSEKEPNKGKRGYFVDRSMTEEK
jgi:hypothetical protein